MGIDLLTLALDGVMFDTEDAQLRACNAAFENYGLDLRWSAAQFREAAHAWGAGNAIYAIIDHLSPPPRDVDHLAQEKHRLFHEFVLSGQAMLHQGCASLMEDALCNGCKLAVVTDMPAKTASTLLQQAFGDAVTNIFEVIVSGADFSDASGNGPHQLALRTVGVDADHCAAIDSASPALRAAQLAGILTIAAVPYQAEVACISGADPWCPRLQELRGLIGGKSAPRDRADRIAAFDILRMSKKDQLNDISVSRKPAPLRPAA